MVGGMPWRRLLARVFSMIGRCGIELVTGHEVRWRGAARRELAPSRQAPSAKLLVAGRSIRARQSTARTNGMSCISTLRLGVIEAIPFIRSTRASASGAVLFRPSRSSIASSTCYSSCWSCSCCSCSPRSTRLRFLSTSVSATDPHGAASDLSLSARGSYHCYLRLQRSLLCSALSSLGVQ